jgi:hypothetical protein
MLSKLCNKIFSRAVNDYHVTNDPDLPVQNIYDPGSLEYLLYQKNSIDTIQWHLEDLIRDPLIDPVIALQIKRRIDKSNQDRTDMVEYLDSYFLDKYANVKVMPGATFNTETPAWAIDRLSILALKIYHMKEEAERKDADAAHRDKCKLKLGILLQQQKDLSVAIDEYLEEIAAGKKRIKVYKQMKMYNDPELNPVFYRKKN